MEDKVRMYRIWSQMVTEEKDDLHVEIRDDVPRSVDEVTTVVFHALLGYDILSVK